MHFLSFFSAFASLGLVKRLGLDRRQASLDCRQASFVLASARTRPARKQNAGLLVGSPTCPPRRASLPASRVLLRPPAEDSQNLSDDSQEWKIIYLQVLITRQPFFSQTVFLLFERHKNTPDLLLNYSCRRDCCQPSQKFLCVY